MSLLHFAYPLLACAGYLAWPKLVRGTLSAPVHRAVSVVHNLALVVFSAYTFWGILKLVLVHGFVFKSKYFFGMPEFDTLAWYFYLSKYYEFIDTFLIYAKGKKPIFLQTYHHVGAVLCWHMWYVYKTDGAWLPTFMNAFVHTVMYTYYLCTIFRLNVSGVKPFITAMQMVQFLIGGIGVPIWYAPPNDTWPRYVIALIGAAYTYGLIALFGQFSYRNYIAPRKSAN